MVLWSNVTSSTSQPSVLSLLGWTGFNYYRIVLTLWGQISSFCRYLKTQVENISVKKRFKYFNRRTLWWHSNSLWRYFRTQLNGRLERKEILMAWNHDNRSQCWALTVSCQSQDVSFSWHQILLDNSSQISRVWRRVIRGGHIYHLLQDHQTDLGSFLQCQDQPEVRLWWWESDHHPPPSHRLQGSWRQIMQNKFPIFPNFF